MPLSDARPPERRVYCNRTLNLRAIRAIGYDMDYTLVHYRAEEWEAAAFEHAAVALGARGWPTDGLRFDADEFTLGLTMDLETGNVVKATRFGYVIRATHGTRPLSFDELRSTYAQVIVDLAEPRFRFMNTLFSLSEASLYAQLVDLLDADVLPGVLNYRDLADVVSEVLDEAHTEGALKAAIVADPDRFVVLDPELPATLHDQRQSGKQLLLITNSEWAYTQAMMSYTVDRFLDAGRTWRDLFDIVIVSAAKPAFFSGRRAVYRVADPDAGLLLPHRGALAGGEVYVGGDASLVESSLGLSGSEVLYLGDHLFGDVHVSKAMLRWRTGLVLRELESEIAAAAEFAPTERRLQELMGDKARLDHELAVLRLARLRLRRGEAVPPGTPTDAPAVERAIRTTVDRAATLDSEIAPLAQAAGAIGNASWGPLMRAGNDKSIFARQVERHADVYTSRVSNLGLETPYAYLRAARGSLPHDQA